MAELAAANAPHPSGMELLLEVQHLLQGQGAPPAGGPHEGSSTLPLPPPPGGDHGGLPMPQPLSARSRDSGRTPRTHSLQGGYYPNSASHQLPAEMVFGSADPSEEGRQYDPRKIAALESEIYEGILEDSHLLQPQGTSALLALQQRLREIRVDGHSPSAELGGARPWDATTAGGSTEATPRGRGVGGTAPPTAGAGLAEHARPQEWPHPATAFYRGAGGPSPAARPFHSPEAAAAVPTASASHRVSPSTAGTPGAGGPLASRQAPVTVGAPWSAPPRPQPPAGEPSQRQDVDTSIVHGEDGTPHGSESKLLEVAQLIRRECEDLAMPRSLFYDIQHACASARRESESNLGEAYELLQEERRLINARCSVLQERLAVVEQRQRRVMETLQRAHSGVKLRW